MSKLWYWLFSIALLGFNLSYGQVNKCDFDNYLEEQKAQDPKLELRMEMAEGQLQQIINRIRAERNARIAAGSGDELPDTSKYIIPVVVWVVHDGGASKISLDQVKSGFEALFRDYRAVEQTMGAASVDTKIEFSLATKDEFGTPCPDGTCVFWKYDPALATVDRSAGEDFTLKTTYYWNKSMYLNLYLVKDIVSSGGTVLGYATFPTFSSTTDGIVIRYDCWGTRGNVGGPGGDNRYGRTATHEMGHWLNLYHTFQGGCGNVNCIGSGDNICDTPPTAQQNFSPQQRQNTCGVDSLYYPDGDRADDPYNYMDYGSDMVIYKFSQGQTDRMIAALENTAYTRRYPLWQWSNVATTGAGPYGFIKAFFYAKNKKVVKGTSTQFVEQSMGCPRNIQWQFPGGNPSTSTDRFPVVTYDTPGTYDVTLIVQNYAHSDTLTLQNYITVVDADTPHVIKPNFIEYFTDSLHKIGWQAYPQYEKFPYITSPYNYINVQKTLDYYWYSAPDSVKGLLRVRNYDFAGFNIRHTWWSPLIDLTNYKNSKIVYDYCYSPHQYNTVFHSDTLEIKISTDYGKTWTTVKRVGGEDLMTIPYPTGTYNPDNLNFTLVPGRDTSYYWKKDTIDLSQYYSKQVYVRFDLYSYEGNNYYMDNFKVTGDYVAGILSNTLNVNIEIFPNPVSDELTLTVSSVKPEDLNISIVNTLGQEMWKSTAKVVNSKTIKIPTMNLPAGTYLLKLNNSNGVKVEKFVKLKD